MSLIATLLKAAASAKSLSEFIENGGVADVIAETSLAAAKISLNKANFANSPRQQVLISVGHLETALAAVARQATTSPGLKAGDVRTMGRGQQLADQHRLICSLMSLCYRYLGEEELCRKQFEVALNPPRRESLGALEVLGFLSLPFTGVPQIFGHRLVGLVKGDGEYFDKVFDEQILGGGRNGVSEDEVRSLQSTLLGEEKS